MDHAYHQNDTRVHVQKIKAVTKQIAFFDFDGTITTKDTMLELIKFSKGNVAFYTGMVFIAPWMVAMKLGLISATTGKEKMLSYFFGGMPLDKFNETCNHFTAIKLSSLLRKSAMEAINKHLANSIEVVIVSASAENWVSPFCTKYGLKFLCTKLEVVNNTITGKLNGANCNAAEKVNRIILSYNPADYSDIFCYGDTKGDKQMLELATQPYFRAFNH